jgi:hypothetical protein
VIQSLLYTILIALVALGKADFGSLIGIGGLLADETVIILVERLVKEVSAPEVIESLDLIGRVRLRIILRDLISGELISIVELRLARGVGAATGRWYLTVSMYWTSCLKTDTCRAAVSIWSDPLISA